VKINDVSREIRQRTRAFKLIKLRRIQRVIYI